MHLLPIRFRDIASSCVSCLHSKTFWNEFEQYWLSITKERICLTKKDIIVGIITRFCPLLDYLFIIAKLYWWDCRRNQTLPNVMAFKLKVQLKYETELYIARTSENMKYEVGDLWIIVTTFFFFFFFSVCVLIEKSSVGGGGLGVCVK